MPDVYSPALAVALALLAGAFVCLVAARLSGRVRLRRLVPVAAALSLVALAVSVTSHLAIGHTPGSDSALRPAPFLTEHPMAVFAALAAVAILLVARSSGGRKT